MSTEAIKVTVDLSTDGGDHSIDTNLGTVYGDDKDRNTHVWLMGLAAIIQGVAGYNGISSDEMFRRLEEFRDLSEPEWEDAPENNLN